MKIELNADDVFQLKRMRDRVRFASSLCPEVKADFTYVSGTAPILTDSAREAQHDLDCINRILNQAEPPPKHCKLCGDVMPQANVAYCEPCLSEVRQHVNMAVR